MALTPADVGERVMVRYALDPAGVAPDGPALTDAVGDLLSWTGGRLRVATRRGPVDLDESALVAGKRLGLARHTRASDASALEVQRVSSLSWRALETERVGGWRLRAGGGFTGRANSVLPLGDPGLPLDQALEYVRRWYAERGLPPRFQTPLPDTAELAAVLESRGWRVHDSAEVMVGDVTELVARAGDPRWDLPPVELADGPSAAWMAAYHYRGGSVPAAGYAVITHHDHVGFATVTGEGEALAIARAAVDGPWVGISAVEVAPSARRRGYATHLLGAVGRWAHEQGARHAQLQVELGNAPAQALYGRLGLTVHHRYDYRVAP